MEKVIMKKVCSYCGLEIEGDTYFKCLDNYLQVKYFETDELNCFCSKECFCNHVMLEEIDDVQKRKGLLWI